MIESSYLKYIFDKYDMKAERRRNGKYKVSTYMKGATYYSEESSISIAILKLCYLIDTRKAGLPFSID